MLLQNIIEKKNTQSAAAIFSSENLEQKQTSSLQGGFISSLRKKKCL